MALHRLTSITLGVPDIDASAAFFRDFGLAGDNKVFGTRDGGDQLTLERSPRRSLMKLGLGTDDLDDLGRIANRVAETGLGKVEESSTDRLVLAEPVTGLRVVVTSAEPYAVVGAEQSFNRPGASQRVNIPAESVLADAPVAVSNLTHVVYGTPDQPTTLDFFTKVLGLEISDQVPGIIAFARCGEVHHNVAIQAAPVAFPHHIAFEVDSVDDVVRGGQAMVDKDPDRNMWGVGRHAIGSNWFWYLRDPSGTFVEYSADIDRITDQDLYQPKQWQGHEVLYSYGPPVPEEFIAPSDMDELIESQA